MNVPIWKPLLIVAVLALAIFFWQVKGLNPGIDIAGGTVLTYQVNVPEETENAAKAIDETVSILANRVDPAGVMNLIWRRVGNSRVEVQMPLAASDVRDLRGVYEETAITLTQSPITGNTLETALLQGVESGGASTEAVEELKTENPAIAGDLSALLAARLELKESRAFLAGAEAAFAQTSAVLADAQANGDVALINDAEARDRAAYTQVSEKATLVSAAQGLVDNLTRTVLTSPIRRDALDLELAKIFALSDKAQSDGTVPRVAALDDFVARFSGREAEVREIADAYFAYADVKGPLDDPEDLKALLRGSGVLEFRIGATSGDVMLIPIAELREQLTEEGPTADPSGAWVWRPVRDIAQWLDNTDMTAEDFATLSDAAVIQHFETFNVVGQRYGEDYYLLLGNTLVNSITPRDQGWEVTSVLQGRDETGFPTVDFKLNAVGAQRLGQITEPNRGKPMAVLLDDQVLTAPRVNDRLSTNVMISGDFSAAEVSYLIRTMKAGSLDATLSDNPISEKTYGPQMGAENLRAGLSASLTALIIVSVFMVLYYFLPGAVAVFALFANMVLILGVMAFIDATFTLPGIAGIVLTIGMAVDANVLIFERIREEQEAGRDLAASVREGYGKALSTILDANITTMITCIVLAYTASAEIKGFAVTLGVGIAATLFTALFCTKVFLDIYVSRSKAQTLAMLPGKVAAIRKVLSPNVNWLKLAPVFALVSLITIGVGLSLVFSRGAEMLDIEFRSGTAVSFRLAEDENGDDQYWAREAVESHLDRVARVAGELNDGKQIDAFSDSDDIAIARLIERLGGESQERYEAAIATAASTGLPPELDRAADFTEFGTASVVTEGDVQDGKASGFAIQTLVTDDRAVSDLVVGIFGGALRQDPSVTFGDDDAESIVAGAPVHRISVSTGGNTLLGDNVESLDVGQDIDVSNYLGGIAILADDLSSPLSVDQFNQRLARIRRQPNFTGTVPTREEVIGLRPAGDMVVDGEAVPTYDGFVYIAADEQVNYVGNVEDFARADGFAQAQWTLVRDAMNRGSSLESVTKFSSQVSGTMKQQAIVAMSLSLFAVVVYIWFRFGSLRYGLAAIAALVHDVTISLGLIAICGYLISLPGIGQLFLLEDFKINLAIVAALLTIVGYSLNDTIVIFDRIRENRGRMARATPEIINESINQTISRTILTSGTTLVALFILYMMGGPGVHGFAFAMLMGVLIGTYSSIAIASPILLIGGKAKGKGGAASAGHTDNIINPDGSPSGPSDPPPTIPTTAEPVT